MAQPQMYNLTTLIKRLEAATSRLEDLATPGLISTVTTPPIGGAIASVPTIASSVAANPAAAPAALPPPQEPEVLRDYDNIINNEVKNYVALSNELGGTVAEQSKKVERCFSEQRKFLLITTKAKKPPAQAGIFMELITGMQKEMTAVGEIRETVSRRSEWFDMVSTVSEGILSIIWVVDAKPGDHISNMIESAMYYANRVLKDYKTSDKKRVDWCQSFIAVLKALQAYVKKHHTAGLTWNEKDGIDAVLALEQVNAASKPSAAAPAAPSGFATGPPPPPPPPGPPPVLGQQLDGPPAASSSQTSVTGAVFAEINQGASVTSRLKKVDKSEMTHKNPSLRVSAVVPDSPTSRAKSPAPPVNRKPPHMKSKKPPRMELEGNKWIIEYFENDHNIAVPQVEINQSVFVFRCKNVVIQVPSKCNAITINECAKTSLVADALVSGIDIIKSTSFAVQVLHKLPTIQVDGCDGGTAYISNESKDVEIFTSKTSAFNVYVADEGENGDYAERAVPEQLKHTIKNGQLVSEIVEHAG